MGGSFSSGVFPRVITTGDNAIRYDDTVWDDEKFPFIGQRIDTTSGRLGYDYTELGIFFADNARYAATEQVSMVSQLSHKWKLESAVYPHFHWFQSSANIPNFLLEYRKYKNGDSVPSTWVKAVSTPVFTYTSGTILQISVFPAVDMTGIDSVSLFTDYKFYRDTLNDSGEFAGADPLTGNALVKEFDVHFEIDTAGSRQEYVK